MIDHQIGALVVGGDHPGLAVARSLGQRNIPVYVLEDQLSVSQWSRYVSRVIRVEDIRGDRATVDAVMEVGHRFGLKGWVLFPTRDEHVGAFSRFREELSKFFRVTTPAWETTQWAWDKKNSYDLAEKVGIPVPKTWTIRNSGELQALYGHLPLAIKPAIKERFFYATGAKAWRANTPEELNHLFSRASLHISAPEILIQEIIPGDGRQQYSFCAFCRNGRVHSSLAARRLRQHPREFGRAATYVETLEMPIIEELSEPFLKHIDYSGLVEIEFKQDIRDGQYKLIDVNARTWGFVSIGWPAGVDFPYLLFADQLGLPIEQSRGRSEVGWMRVVSDVPTALLDLVSGHLSLRTYFSSLVNTRVESVFAKGDPLPAVAELVLLPYLVAKKYF
ncbi:MAG: ATP-grasp domain-containing protein [Nitrospira sp. WS110]|nr:ATP-grasp domain-containing protein [Nitrospira sp. WS110]